MSDPSQPPPPKPKPGSLRDRIAAFEKPVPSSTAPKPSPPVRPKPGNVTWKPAPPSPPSNKTEAPETDEKKQGGMSASDAKESIGKGGSLKERMAALQGKGAFGAGSPPPPPGPKPVKRPPLVVSPPAVEESEESGKDLGAGKPEEQNSEHHPELEGKDGSDAVMKEDKQGTSKEEEHEPSEEQDEEAKERERRATIAARMARLGGARVGMAPPVFGRKPDVKEKPQVAPPREELLKETEHSANVTQKAEPTEKSVSELLTLPGDPINEKAFTPTEVKETTFDVPRVITDDEVTSENTGATPLPPLPVLSTSDIESPSVADPESHPTSIITSSSQTSPASSRSPPSSMPIPAVPRRAGPPRKKSSRNLKTEAKKQGESSSESPLATPELHTNIDTAPVVALTTPSESARQGFAQEDDLTAEHDTLQEPAPVYAFNTNDHTTASIPIQSSDEREIVQKAVESPEEIVDQQTHEISDGPVSQPANDSLDLVDGRHTPTEEVVVRNHAEDVAESHEHDPSPELSTTDSKIQEPQEPGTPARDKQFIDDKLQALDIESENPDRPTISSPVLESGTPAAPAYEPIEEHRDIIATPVRLHAPDDEDAETALLQDLIVPKENTETREQVEPEKTPAPIAAESETEDEEAARKKRIAERMAKMGGRNPFSTSPFFGVAGPAKKVVDEQPEIHETSSPNESPAVEKDYKNIVSGTSAEAAAEAESPEAGDQETRGNSTVEELESGVYSAEDTFEEHESIDFEHNSISHIPHAGSEESFENYSPQFQGVPSIEEAEEMAPPRITRAVPPPPAQILTEVAKECIVPPMGSASKRSSLRHSLPPPFPLPEQNLAQAQDSPTARHEDEGIPEVQNVAPDGKSTTPLTPISIISLKNMPGDEVEIDRSSVSPTTPRRVLPSPPRVVPTAPSTRDSMEFRSPTTLSSRRSLPPPPRAVPIPPTPEVSDVVKESSPVSPTSPRRTISPPARPVSPEIVSPRPASVRRSIPPPPPPGSEPTRPPRRMSSQTVEAATSLTSDRTLLYDIEENADAAPQLQTTESPTRHMQIIPIDSIEEQEILPDHEPDPIDPALYSPPRSPAFPHEQPQISFRTSSREASADVVEEDSEQIRRQTIAERMAKLGGIRFGAPPPIPRKPAGPPVEVTPSEIVNQDHGKEEQQEEYDGTVDDVAEPDDSDAQEIERSRREAIATRLAGMGGMRFGMLPQLSPSAHPRGGSDDRARTAEQRSPAVLQPHASAPPPDESTPLEADLESVSDEGVKVEAGSEMSMEEVNPEDVEDAEEIMPPIPSRPSKQSHPPLTEVAPPPLPPGRRPPMPVSVLPSRPPVPKTEPKRSSTSDSMRKTSGSSVPSVQPAGDFVIVDEEGEIPPPPPPRSRPSRAIPPPAPPSKEFDSSPWELPEIPRGSFDLNVGAGLGMGDKLLSLEDSTMYPPASTATSSIHPIAPVSTPALADLTPEDLLDLCGGVGTTVYTVASNLFEKSKKSVVGDGTSQGFVNAVLALVPQASKTSYGHLIYSQSGNSVLRRSSPIMPGDVVQLTEAKLKGHKGLQSYHQSAGTAQEPLVGVVSEFDVKKSKVKVFQANQHVGSQTVEMASYRLDDLKSGSVKVFRVANA
ncbi:hypothetical protein K439DRAFT_1655459 [Ramaria rubella]|nr:hypothetical protein K439DRAFT_1655459 [Ramaria rubella]